MYLILCHIVHPNKTKIVVTLIAFFCLREPVLEQVVYPWT